MRDKQFQLLGTQRFLPLFLTQLATTFNDILFTSAMAVMIAYQLMTKSYAIEEMMSLTAGVYILPFVLFSATAGRLADKYNKARIAQIIKAIEIPLILIGIVALITSSIPLLFITLFALGTHSTFFGPVKYAIIPELLEEEDILGANALVEASTLIAILLGTLAGNALILTQHGVGVVSLILLSVAIGGWFASRSIPATLPAEPNLTLQHTLFKENLDIIQKTRKNREIFLAILGLSWFWLIGTIFKTHLVSYSRDVLGVAPTVASIFIAALTIGVILGSLLCNRLLQGRISSKYVPISILGISLFVFDLCFSSQSMLTSANQEFIGVMGFFSHFRSYHLLLDVLLLGFCAGIYVVPLFAIIQTHGPKQFRARTIAANNIINAFFMVGASLITLGLTAIHFSILQIFFIMGVANTIVAGLICKMLPEAVVKSFIHWALRLFYKVDVRGLNHYYEAGERLLIIANHTSLLDIILLSAFLPDKFTIAVNTEVAKKWWIKPFIALVESFPIDPTSPMATKSIIKVINAGKKCMIFPEGRLTTTGSLMKVYEGPGMIADKTKATILPVRIDGAQHSPFSNLRGKVRIRWFPKITLTILPPKKFPARPELSSRERRRYLGTQIYLLMSEMMFDSSCVHQPLFQSLLDTRKVFGSRWKIAEDIERKAISYRDLIARAFILGKSIASNTQFQEYVGVMLPTSNTGMITFFALQAYGRIPAMLNFSAGASNLISACQTGRVKKVYTAHKFISTAKLEDVIEKMVAAGIEIIYLEDLRESIGILQKLSGYIKAFFAESFFKRVANKISAKNPAVLLFTSGSEGKPKGVLLSHDNIHANIYQMHARVDFTSHDIMFSALPIFHSFGLTVGMILPIISGIRTFFYPNPLHYRIVPELVYDTNATIMFGTDTFLTGYARYAHPYDFYSVRYIFAGAEKLKPETNQLYAEKFGVRVFEGYGATETSPVVSTNTPMQNKLGSVGCFFPGIEYRLEPVEGITQGGRLVVSGPNIMCGYLRSENPGVIEPPKDGWYDTGDIVSVDEQGYIHICGRAKRFAKIGGEMVSLAAVESYVSALWKDYHHAVVSIPDPKKGEQLVLLTDYEGANREAIIAYIQQNDYSEITIPRQVIIAKTMPILATGKIDYKTVESTVFEAVG